MNYCSHGYLMLTCPRCTQRAPDPRNTAYGTPAEGQLTIDLNDVVNRAAQRVAGSAAAQQTYRPPIVDDPALD